MDPLNTVPLEALTEAVTAILSLRVCDNLRKQLTRLTKLHLSLSTFSRLKGQNPCTAQGVIKFGGQVEEKQRT